MPYCRKCGAQLEETARFCHKCGTSVVTYTPPAAPSASPRPLRKDPLVVAAIGLVIILVSAAVIVALLTAPLSTWEMGMPYRDDSPEVNTLNLSFDADIGQINVFTQKMGENDNILIYVSAKGSQNIFGGTETPVTVTFDNQTTGDVLTVNARVSVENRFSSHADIDCNIYVDPALQLNLNITSHTGKVGFSADKATTIQNLKLQTTTGEVEAHLQKDVTIAGDITLQTTTGAVNYRMSETNIAANCTLNLKSTTGEINMDITQTKTLQGNLNVDAETATGSINLGLVIDGGVAAKITSQIPALGNIETRLNNFNGDKAAVQSNNYPAASNIEISNRVNGIGGININANYLTTTIAS
jgi:hypothetical protein